ncbi:MAG: carbamoyltransferase HypF [Actinomycetia bacterium]|nr:carbamoyltransferase HypF [Actinomycetes bacterium]
MLTAFAVQITGVVQGVGFRPFVYRLAQRYRLCGWVLNAADGVHLQIEGPLTACLDFLQALELETPAAAQIDQISTAVQAVQGFTDFTIRSSEMAAAISSAPSPAPITHISPDLACCPQCQQELFDPSNRRYLYPFINCTDCGPRFTIITGLPYDRPQTTMHNFVMCEQCQSEYQDPSDRRFHAQPDACFACGPALALFDGHKTQTARGRAISQDLIQQVAAALLAGRIVAIKGLGGYHLACDASNPRAVQELRRRKQRSRKPLAVMMANLDWVREYCQVSAEEAALLNGSVRPIVLLRRRPAVAVVDSPEAEATAAGQRSPQPLQPLQLPNLPAPQLSKPLKLPELAAAVAGDLRELGVMLPSTPLQLLLFAQLDRPLVMTSGNLSEEPIIGDTAGAHQALAGVADLWLDNNRPIASRYDDSVVRVVAGQLQMIRRARGYAPQPLRLPQSASRVLLAVGAEQKNCFCLAAGTSAFVAQHLGDLDNADALANWDQSRQLYEQLFQLTPQLVVRDAHPAYHSSQWAEQYAQAQKLPLFSVQHHHAHIASVLAEAQTAPTRPDRQSGAPAVNAINAGGRTTSLVSAPPQEVLGFAFDGTGLGDDGSIWGGEVLRASLTDYERLAYLRPTALPGADAAVREPGRMAWSWLTTCRLTEHPGARALREWLGDNRQQLLNQIIAERVNSPWTSSMGRLFDAVSALCGLCYTASYEGEAAVELEAALPQLPSVPSPIDLASSADPTGSYQFAVDGQILDPAPLFQALLTDLAQDCSPAIIAWRFHQAVVNLVVNVALQLRQQTGLTAVALAGGVFQNRYLLEQIPPALVAQGFAVYTNRELPPNDGSIAYGQAAVVAARLAAKE